MGKMLLGLAAAIAVTAFTTPAAAGSHEPLVGIPNAKGTVGTLGGSGGFGSSGVGIGFGHSGVGDGGFGDGRFDRRHGGSGDLGIWVNGGEWAHYNNQTFQSDSYNDWWHNRPDRAYPAWMRNNQNCQRQWYAGNMLRC